MSSPVVAIDFAQGWDDAWSDIASFFPKAIAFVAILIVGYFIAKILARVCTRLLDRTSFDDVVERGGVKRALANSQYDATQLVGKAIFYTLLLVVLTMAFGVFGENPVSDMLSSVISYLPKLFVAIVIMIVAAFIAAMAKDMIRAALGGLSYGPMLAAIASVAILVIGAFAALSQMEIAPAIINSVFYALLAVIAGSAIIAIGGGGIQPMRQRWENALNKYDEEKPRLQLHMQQKQQERAAQTPQGGTVQGRGGVDVSRSQERAAQGAQGAQPGQPGQPGSPGQPGPSRPGNPFPER
jgi:hypothetical protein